MSVYGGVAGNSKQDSAGNAPPDDRSGMNRSSSSYGNETVRQRVQRDNTTMRLGAIEMMDLKLSGDVTEQLDQSDTYRRNIGTTGVVSIDVPFCGQFYDISLDETSCEASSSLDPSPAAPFGQTWTNDARPSGMSLSRYPLTPGEYTRRTAPEVECCATAQEPQRCALRHPCTPYIRSCDMTQGGQDCHVTRSGQTRPIPNRRPCGITLGSTPVQLMGSTRPFGMAPEVECCGTTQRVLALPSFATQPYVPCRTTHTIPLLHSARASNQAARDCMQRCGAAPGVISFRLGQPEVPRVPSLEHRLYSASLQRRHFEVVVESRDVDIASREPGAERRDESVAGHYGWPPGGAATRRTLYDNGAQTMRPCDAAINCHMCTADRNQSSEVDVEASGFTKGTGQSWATPCWRLADQHGQLLDATVNCQACMAEQHGRNATASLPFWVTGEVPSCETARDTPAYDDVSDFPSSQLMPNGPFFSISRDAPSCEITCETTPVRKQGWMTSKKRSVTTTRSGPSNKLTRDQKIGIVRHKNTRDLSRGTQRNTVSRNGHPFDIMGNDGMLGTISREWKRCGQLQGVATGKALMQDATPVVVSLKSRSREISQVSATHAKMLRTEMHWDYYIPGLPDHATEHDEGFTSRSRQDAPPKPVAIPPPIASIEPTRAPPVEIPDNSRAPMDWSQSSTWSRLFERVTRKAIQVVHQVVLLIAPVAKPALQSLPAPAPHRTTSVGRVPQVPRLGRSAMCRRCLREQVAKTSENFDDPQRLTSSSVLERYYSGEAAHVIPLAEGLRNRIRQLQTECALATAFPHSRTLPDPILEKSLSDPVLPLRHACCPRHRAGSPVKSGSDSRLQDTTSSSPDTSPTNTDDDRDWDGTSNNTYATARPALDDINDGSELSGSHLLSPWHNIDQYSLVFVDAMDDIVASSDCGGGDGGDSLDDVGSLPSTRSLTRSHTRTLSMSPTPTDQPSLDSGDSFRRSDLSDDGDSDDDDVDDVIDSALGVDHVVDCEGRGVVLCRQGDDEDGYSQPRDVMKVTGKLEDEDACDDHLVKNEGNKNVK